MPRFMDIHDGFVGVTQEQFDEAHRADLAVQADEGVSEPAGYRHRVVTLDQVAAMALALPGATEGERHGHRAWSVAGKTFAWQRRFSQADLKRYGEVTPPSGEILAVRVADLGEKEAVLASGLEGFFTIAHFNGYPAVLVELARAGQKAVGEVLVDAWLDCAPELEARAYAERVGH
jgi:hypothetical protein